MREEELLRRIEELEKKVRELETRPEVHNHHHYPQLQWVGPSSPWYVPSTIWCVGNGNVGALTYGPEN